MLEMNYHELDQVLPRYLRLVASQQREEERCRGITDLCKDQEAEAKLMIQPIAWLPSFYAMPGYLKLSQILPQYKSLGLFPMDLASSLPILCLGLTSTQSCSVLDLCCCPGAKFQLISEQLTTDSTVVGVDISESRLRVCKSLLETWQQHFHEQKLTRAARQLLFHGDGIKFDKHNMGDLLFDSEVFYLNDLLHQKTNRKRKNKSSKVREAKLLKTVANCLSAADDSTIADNSVKETEDDEVVDVTNPADEWRRNDDLQNFKGKKVSLADFDFVLVDAECTHDASYRHMKFVERGFKWTKDNRNISTTNATTDEVEGEEGAEKAEILLSHNIRDLKTSAEGREELQHTQRGLIGNGFRQLKVGGTLVYSTCSQEQEQNEDVVQWLLDSFPTAQLQSAIEALRRQGCPVKVLRDGDKSHLSAITSIALSETESTVEQRSIALFQAMSQAAEVQLYEGLLPGTIKVNAETGMSGHFIARITKTA